MRGASKAGANRQSTHSHETPVLSIEEGTISASAFLLEVILSNVDQLGVSTVVGQYEHHR